MEIRLARRDEVDALARIVQRAYEPYVARMERRPAPMDDDYHARVAKEQVSLAVVDNLPVGLIVTMLRSDHLLIENVAVDPVAHGQGIGRALLEHAEQLAVVGGVRELRLYTNAAMVENLAMYPRSEAAVTDSIVCSSESSPPDSRPAYRTPIISILKSIGTPLIPR